jgi:hypothetical protein
MIAYEDIAYEGAPYRERWNQAVVRGGDGRMQRPPSTHRYVDVSRQFAPWGEHRLQGLGIEQMAATRQRAAMSTTLAARSQAILATPRVGEPSAIDKLPWWTWVAVPMILGGAALFAYDQGWIGRK